VALDAPVRRNNYEFHATIYMEIHAILGRMETLVRRRRYYTVSHRKYTFFISRVTLPNVDKNDNIQQKSEDVYICKILHPPPLAAVT